MDPATEAARGAHVQLEVGLIPQGLRHQRVHLDLLQPGDQPLLVLAGLLLCVQPRGHHPLLAEADHRGLDCQGEVRLAAALGSGHGHVPVPYGEEGRRGQSHLLSGGRPRATPVTAAAASVAIAAATAPAHVVVQRRVEKVGHPRPVLTREAGLGEYVEEAADGVERVAYPAFPGSVAGLLGHPRRSALLEDVLLLLLPMGLGDQLGPLHGPHDGDGQPEGLGRVAV